MPYCPLWTALLIRDHYNTNRFANSYVQNYFGNVKLHLIESEQNLKRRDL